MPRLVHDSHPAAADLAEDDVLPDLAGRRRSKAAGLWHGRARAPGLPTQGAGRPPPRGLALRVIGPESRGRPQPAEKPVADEDPDSPLNRYWDEEHDRHVLRCLLELAELEFEPTTMRAFRRVALEGASGSEAAGELGLSLATVYAARSRILRRLRELAEGLLDELP